MKALILGGAGMLGHTLARTLAGHAETWVTLRRSFAGDDALRVLDKARVIAPVDATREPDLDRAFDIARPDVVYNCVGVVKQRAEARDPIPSIAINSLLPHQLAARCLAARARLVHLSTDCVFSGSKGAYTEADVPDATDLYGRTKLLGEVDAPGCITVRTSMIGRELEGAHGLVEWFLAHRGETVRGFTRAIFSGFTTLELSRILADLGDRHRSLTGLWHVSAEPIAKFDLLNLVNHAMNLGTRIEPDSSFECDRSLDSSRFREATGYTPPSWRAMLEELAHDTSPYDSRVGSWTSMESTSS